MAQSSIPVDLFNPGQVFACMGFLEAAELLVGNAVGSFEWGQSGVFFNLCANGNTSPVLVVLCFVKIADVRWLSPRDDLRERDGGITEIVPGIAASGDPKAPDLPGILRGEYERVSRDLPFGYWADGSGRFATTFKKSTNGASSHPRQECLGRNTTDGPRESGVGPFQSGRSNRIAISTRSPRSRRPHSWRILPRQSSEGCQRWA